MVTNVVAYMPQISSQKTEISEIEQLTEENQPLTMSFNKLTSTSITSVGGHAS